MREERGRGREGGQGTVEGKGEQGKMAEQNPKCICGDITAFPTGPLTLDEASIQGLGEAPTLSLKAFLLGNSGAFLKACIND